MNILDGLITSKVLDRKFDQTRVRVWPAWPAQTGPPRGGGKQKILPQGPQTIEGLHEALIFTCMGCIFTLFLYLLLSIAWSELNK